jgi:hypothetical protein
MRSVFSSLILVISLILVSCNEKPVLKNLTRPGGYAIGENVRLVFSVSGKENAPDSLAVKLFEKKTEYIYETLAARVDAEDTVLYEYYWDGRKPDGSWPAGGRYWVYAVIPEIGAVSDTVEIGLTD